MSTLDPLARIKKLLAQGGMSRATDVPIVAQQAPAPPPAQVAPVRPVDPRIAQIQALQQQAEMDARPRPQPGDGVGKQLLFAAIQGLRGAAGPQGYTGMQAHDAASERQRQQDLYARVKELQSGMSSDRQFDLQNQREDRLVQGQQDSLEETRRLRTLQEAQGASTRLQNDDQNRIAQDRLRLDQRKQDYEESKPKGEDKEVHTYTGEDGFTYTDFKRPDGTVYTVKSSAKARQPAGPQPSDFDKRLKLMRENPSEYEKMFGSKDSTGVERRAMNFYIRASDALGNITSMEPEIQKMGLGSQTRLALAPNVFQSHLGQQYRAAQRQFTEARLRKDSGAAIPPHEYENDAKMYFAVPGDGPQVLKDKEQARQAVMEGLKQEANRAYTEYTGEPPRPTSPGGGGGAVEEYERDPKTGKLRLKVQGK